MHSMLARESSNSCFGERPKATAASAYSCESEVEKIPLSSVCSQ